MLVRELAALPAGVTVTCAGVSMQPALWRGQRVQVQACTRLRTGDVVLFELADGTLEMHRLVARVPLARLWVHRGDNQRSPRPGLVRDAAIIGLVALPRVAPSLRVRLDAARRLVEAVVRGMYGVIKP